jgi:hypothetical protein
MEAVVDQPKPWLKYVDAGGLDESSVDFDGMNVESATGEHLGEVDGFIVDSGSGRPYYVVVASGGWFKTKHFLLPVGHARLDATDDGEGLVAELTRDQVDKFPGFDLGEFDKLSADELRRINDETCAACSVTTITTYDASQPYSTAWERPDFRSPDWWTATPSRPDRMGEAAITAGAALGRDTSPVTRRSTSADPVLEQTGSRKPGDDSPHLGGRAQPGDVLGIETGGERTHVGETSEDEDRRREDATKAARESTPARR